MACKAKMRIVLFENAEIIWGYGWDNMAYFNF